MRAELLEGFRLESDASLFASLTVNKDDFTEEEQTALRQVAAERGFQQEHFERYRALLETKDNIVTTCPGCRKKQTIKKKNLLSGSFYCQACDKKQTIDFRNSFPVIQTTEEMLNQLDDGSLMRTVAFEVGNYSKDEIEQMHAILLSRGFTDQDIDTFRYVITLGKDAQVTCRHCSYLFSLGCKELWRGDVTCPRCDKDQFIDYKSLKPLETLTFESTREKDDRSVSSEYSPSLPKEPPDSISGLRGWLLLLGINLFIELAIAIGLLCFLYGKKDTVAFLIVLFWSFYLTVTFIAYLKKSRAFPTLLIALLSANVMLTVTGLFIDIFTKQNLTLSSLPPSVENVFAAVMGALIWIPYIRNSKRAKATFVN